MTKIEDIEGVGAAYAKDLAKAEIRTVEGLLEACATPAGRRRVAKETGVSEAKLLKWANMADLRRIKGIGSEFSELLEASGVDTVKELRKRKAENLAATMAEVNAKKKLTRVVPAEGRLSDWIDQAKSLPPKMKY